VIATLQRTEEELQEMSKDFLYVKWLIIDNRSHEVGWDDFEIIKEVGKGAYGTVWLVKKKATGKMYAMKTVDWADRVKLTLYIGYINPL